MFIGARFSSRAPDYLIRPSLIVVLLLSGMKLIGVVQQRSSRAVTPIAVAAASATRCGPGAARGRRSPRAAGGATRADGVPVGIAPAPPAPAGVDRSGA